MERHKRRSRGQWEELVGDQERSGLSAKDFCKGKTIGLASFYQWRGRLREKESRSKSGIESKGSFIDMGKIDSHEHHHVFDALGASSTRTTPGTQRWTMA